MRNSGRRQPLEILHVDADVAVVVKPPHVLVGRSCAEVAGVVDLLRGRPELGESNTLKVVQRLYEQAAGVVVYARTDDAKRDLTAQFSSGDARVTYLALVAGYVEDDGEIDTPLYYDKRSGRLVACQRRGSPALTRYRIVQRVAGATLLECRPENERTDQLRVHLAAIDHPLAVDAAMGGGQRLMLSDYKSGYRPSARRPERPLIERLTLHAATLTFRRPSGGGPMEFSAPPPKDLSATLMQLGKLV